MKQSERVTEAVQWALEKLSSMSKEELDQRLAARELGPVGELLLKTGTIRTLLDERAEKSIFVVVELPHEGAGQLPAADNAVRYTLSPWATIAAPNKGSVIIGKTGLEDKKWAKAA